MTFLPLLGYFSDRGSNPMKRKLCSLFVGMSMFLCGLLFLIIAGFLKLESLDAIYWSTHTNISSNDTPIITQSAVEASRLSSISLNDTFPSQTLVPNKPISDSQVSVTAVLSILAFSFIDIGFDMSISLVRAFILEIMSTVSASMAGTTFSFLGCFDFPGALGPLFHVEGVAATLIFFCSLLFCLILIGYSCTIISGYFINKGMRQLDKGKNTNRPQVPNAAVGSVDQGTPSSSRRRLLKGADPNTADQIHTVRPYLPDILHTEEGDTSTRPLLLEDSLKANNYSALSISTASVLHAYGSHEVHVPKKQFCVYKSASTDNATHTGDTSDTEAELLQQTEEEQTELREEADLEHKKHPFSTFSLLEAIKQSYSMSLSIAQSPLGEFHTRKLENMHKKRLDDTKQNNKLIMNKRLIILCCSCFFTFGSMITFIIYISNALNIGIFKGDPTALPGTEAYDYYQAGLRTAALGNLVLYATYMTISINNTKTDQVDRRKGTCLISCLTLTGEKVQFVACHVLVIASLLTLIVTQRVEIYFVFMVSCGALRTCVFTLPFILANKFTQVEVSVPDNSDADVPKKNLGKVMSLIGFLIPAHYILVSIIMGPLMDATGNVWVPLIYSWCSCTISLLIFIPLFFVKN
ncbi:unnamed protein product [Candidula unifasciata]|uniref:Uncharacterized protein n=1 Tax=Candidula unifasciata TaxID=100452 RepID=A0A8S3ZGM7_9EUPU|nr:unnamed protein product [Candidula unifasciata]